MKILIDSNILVYAHNTDSKFNKQSKNLMKDALKRKINACISIQNLLEFYSIITNPKRVEKPIKFEEAREIFNLYSKSLSIKIIYPTSKSLLMLSEFLNLFQITKAEIFDAYLVATMKENNVKTIYTENTSHFERYDFLKVVNPFNLIKEN